MPKCHACHSLQVYPIGDKNTKFQLTEVKEGSILIGSGLPVSAAVCTSCGTIVLYNTDLIGQQPTPY